jgi:hypothetical protein
MNDYWLGPLIEVDNETVGRHLSDAKQLSLSLLYWLQTEAPRPDGGTGFPGLRLRPDIVDTQDGLAKTPYVRESRRIRAVTTVTEHDVAVTTAGLARQDTPSRLCRCGQLPDRPAPLHRRRQLH